MIHQGLILHPIILVHWRDATSQDDWTPAKDILPIYSTVKTVGQYITENEDVLTVGLNHDLDNDNWSCIIHIPKGMILSRTILHGSLEALGDL